LDRLQWVILGALQVAFRERITQPAEVEYTHKKQSGGSGQFAVVKLHVDSITFDPHDKTKVLFQAFIGISPRRYRDIFEKKKRKNLAGKVLDWNEGRPMPRIEDRSSAYIENESPLAVAALGSLYGRRQTAS
jgi:translation elongation factor EF-G